MEPLIIALFLATVNNRILEYLFEPIRRRYPTYDFWWLLYIALFTGGLLGWFSGINLFASYLPDPIIGRVLTAIVIGGGSNLIHRIFEKSPEVVIETPALVEVQDELVGEP